MQAVIIGAGGFGREVFDWLRSSVAAKTDERVDLLGFVDDGVPDLALLERIGARYLGSVDWLAAHPNVVFYVAIGDPSVREELAARAEGTGAKAGPALIHAAAVVGSDVDLGAGSIICPNVTMTTNLRFGMHCHVNINATVGHDCTFGSYVTINPGATVSGSVTLEDGVTVGTGAAIIQGVTVGRLTTIGAGAAVVRDLPPAATAVGVPARPLNR